MSSVTGKIELTDIELVLTAMKRSRPINRSTFKKTF